MPIQRKGLRTYCTTCTLFWYRGVVSLNAAKAGVNNDNNNNSKNNSNNNKKKKKKKQIVLVVRHP